jgi:hypothetical protein
MFNSKITNQSTNTDERSIQQAIKALQNFFNDEVIHSIEDNFKQFNVLLTIFEDYEHIVNLQGGLINLINSLTVESLTHLDEHQTPNTKKVEDPSNHDLKNEKTGEQLIYLLDRLKLLANNVAYSKRIGFMRDILNAPNKKEILFNNVFTEKRINKRFRKLVSCFHPDKTSGLNVPDKLKEEYITLSTELFKCALEFKKSLLELEESSKNDDFTQTLHEEKANELWKIAIYYRNAHKEQPSEELKRNSIDYGLKAYEEYRAACKIADNNKQFKNQIKLRGYMALSLYISDKFMEAQLYALAAINLVIRNSTNATRQDLYEAKQIFDKVKSGNSCGSEVSSTLSVELFVPKGVSLTTLGLYSGYHQIKIATQLLGERKTRESLNEIMEQALLAYDKGDHQKFFEELSKEYKSGSRLIKLMHCGDSINHESVINALIEHGFRSDGIAYLLILISEVLISGKIKIQGMLTEELKSQGYHVLYGALSERLEKEASELDNRIQKLRKEPLKSLTSIFRICTSLFMGLDKTQECNRIAKEYKDDAEEISFVSRLEEMRNIARINLAIRDILYDGPEEIKRAKEVIEQVQESIKSHRQHIGMVETCLEALEDLLWVVSGESANFKID